MRDDAGQALILAVLLLGVAAATAAGLLAAQERMLVAVRELRAGEAAVAAAGAVLADEHIGLSGSSAVGSGSPVVAAPLAVERALAAARDLAELHGPAVPHGLQLQRSGERILVELTLANRRHRASIEAVPCCPR
jgi:hypothetical protein